jgi:hypothetical protein
MLAIARYALKSPFHAATVVGILAILSLFIPLVSILSGAIVGLIILTQGIVSGTRAIVVAIVGISVITYLLTQSPEWGIVFGLVQWLPMMIMAEVLRRSGSLSLTLVVGLVLALLAVVGQYLMWPDSEKAWMQIFTQLFQGAENSDIDFELFKQSLQVMVHWMILMLVAAMYCIFIGTLLWSRSLQARLAGSNDAYRKEFYAIRLGKTVAAVGLLLILGALLLKQDWLMAMAIVLLATFLYQGLAIVHSWSKTKGSSAWLVGLYVLMVIFPQVVGLTALLGIIDNWTDFRSKIKSVPE